MQSKYILIFTFLFFMSTNAFAVGEDQSPPSQKKEENACVVALTKTQLTLLSQDAKTLPVLFMAAESFARSATTSKRTSELDIRRSFYDFVLTSPTLRVLDADAVSILSDIIRVLHDVNLPTVKDTEEEWILTPLNEPSGVGATWLDKVSESFPNMTVLMKIPPVVVKAPFSIARQIKIKFPELAVETDFDLSVEKPIYFSLNNPAQPNARILQHLDSARAKLKEIKDEYDAQPGPSKKIKLGILKQKGEPRFRSEILRALTNDKKAEEISVRGHVMIGRNLTSGTREDLKALGVIIASSTSDGGEVKCLTFETNLLNAVAIALFNEVSLIDLASPMGGP